MKVTVQKPLHICEGTEQIQIKNYWHGLKTT